MKEQKSYYEVKALLDMDKRAAELKRRMIIIVLGIITFFVLMSLACDNGGTDVIRDASNSCNDITSCVNHTPDELANLCQVAGGYHDASGNCVTR